MTISLFSQLIRDIGGESGVTGLNKLALSRTPASESFLINAVLQAYWLKMSSDLGNSDAGLSPTAILVALSGLPETQDITDDFFFI
jgi:hypothetical protein